MEYQPKTITRICQTIVVFFVLLFFPPVCAQVDVTLTVRGCNDNNICQAELGENTTNCSNDCTLCNNNGVCELLKGESTATCPSDCPLVVPPVEIPPTTPTSQSGGRAGGYVSAITINNVRVIVQMREATISWNTSVPTYGLAQWGTSIDYTLGSIDTIGISTTHKVKLENLEPGVTYYYKIIASLPGVYPISNAGIFTTHEIGDSIPPANVSRLTVAIEENDIVLTWQNPLDNDFAGVKILRSPYFFPRNAEDGKLIYDGAGIYARDTNIDPDKIYFYSVFSYDFNKNYSSGALIQISGKIPTDVGKGIRAEEKIRLDDFSFVQNDIQLPISGITVRLYPFYDTDISILKTKVAEFVQSFIIKITDPISPGNHTMYKLSLSDDKKIFAGTMGIIGEEGIYPFFIESIGYDNSELGRIDGYLDARSVKIGLGKQFGWQYIVIIVIAIILAVLHVMKNRREKNRKLY